MVEGTVPGKDSVVGVRRNLALSKRDLLLFDKVLLSGFALSLLEVVVADPGQLADANFLVESDFLIDLGCLDEWRGEVLRTLDHRSDEEWRAISDLGVLTILEEAQRVDLIDSYLRHDTERPAPPAALAECSAAICSFALKSLNVPSAPIFSRSPTQTEWSELRQLFLKEQERLVGGSEPATGELTFWDRPATTELVEILIPSLPLPGDDVSLDYILEFSRDPATVARKRRLIRTIAKAELEHTGPQAFRLDMEESISDYRDHMRLADLRGHTATITVLLSIAGAVEELFHLRPRKAVDSLLEFRKVKADRMEAELMAPGRDFAFIYEAEKRFGRA